MTKPSGRDASPPMASWSMAAAPARLPNTQSSSTSTYAPLTPAKLLDSAAMTFKLAPVNRWVMVLVWAETLKRADNSLSTRIMSCMGENELLATSLVGATMTSSQLWRSFKIKAVSMMPAASVDFEFFLLINRKNSLIKRFLAAGSYAPKMMATKSNTHALLTAPIFGQPMTSTSASSLNTRNAMSLIVVNSGLHGIRDSPLTIRSCQSGRAVVHVGVTLLFIFANMLL